MKKKILLIHGWASHPDDGCFPWLKQELESRGFAVANPAMPDPSRPKIGEWVSFLAGQVGAPDENTYLIGHSIGSQTILRYLETLPKEAKIGGAVFLAGWVNLLPAAYEEGDDSRTASPWLTTALDWEKIKLHIDKFVAIFSDNDPYVPLSDAKIFEVKLGAKIIVEHEKEHFSDIKNLPSILEATLQITGEKT